MAFADRAPGRPLVLGHRGLSARHPENTLVAFRAAVDAGADGVELDVRRCRTGEVVVFHDDDLRRLAGRSEAVSAVPLAELRALDLGGGAGVPTLSETFAAIGDALVNVEIKRVRAAELWPLVDGVARAIEAAGAAERVLISSFDPRALWLARFRIPSVERGLLFHAGQKLARRRSHLAPALGAAALHPEHVLVDAASIARWRRRGYRVNTWTVDDPPRQRELARLGVDAIICNDPGAAVAALEAR